MVSEFYWECLWFEIWYKNIDGGCLVGPIYIASLWLGSLLGDSRLKGLEYRWRGFVLHVARLALISADKGLIIIYAPILMIEGGQCYKAFVFYFMDPIQIITNIYDNAFDTLILK